MLPLYRPVPLDLIELVATGYIQTNWPLYHFLQLCGYSVTSNSISSVVGNTHRSKGWPYNVSTRSSTYILYWT